jgi:hypothetical protein
MDWRAEIEAQGKMWATPGKYLRNSMLTTLARRISGRYLPEVFWEGKFDQADGCATRSEEDEKTLVMSLDVRLRSESRESVRRFIRAQNEGDEDDDEGGAQV